MGKSNRIFYGWWVLVALFFSCTSIAISPFPVILKPLMNEFHTGRGPVSAMLFIYFLSAAIGSFIIARFLEHHSPRKFLLWGSLIGGTCYLLCSLTQNLWHLYVLYAIMGVAINGILPLAMVALASRWFKRRRGMATGIAFAGPSVLIMALIPAVGFIAQHFGWRATYLFAGLLTLAICVPLHWLVTRDTPEEIGLLPDGVKPDELKIIDTFKPVTEAAIIDKKVSLSSYFRHLPIWAVCFIIPFVVIGEIAIQQHEVSFITDMGIPATLAATAFGFTSGLSGLGKFISGSLTDKISTRYIAVIFLIIELVGMIILMHAKTMATVWIFVIVYGIGSGTMGTLFPLMVRDIFGSTNFNTVFGLGNATFMCGIALGTPLAGFIFDATGSYHWVFIIVAILFAIAMVTIYSLYGLNPRPWRNLRKQR